MGENACEELERCVRMIRSAVLLLQTERCFIERYIHEHHMMDAVGALFSPSLFLSANRREIDDLMFPVFQAVKDLLDVFEQKRKDLERLSPDLE